MAIALELAKDLARTFWFREGTIRKAWIGPYAGIRFAMCPQMLRTRMCVFYGPYEPEVTDVLASSLRPGMVVYNVGAHVGIHTLFMAKQVGPEGTVCAFEAWPSNFEYLERNAESNRGRIGTVIPVAKAVLDRNGSTAMTQGETDGTHHLTGRAESASVAVEGTTLDDFADETGLRPGLVLVDAEGAELEVLRGAERILRDDRPDWLLEHHGPAYLQAVVEKLRTLGYEISPVGTRHIYAWDARGAA